MDGFAFASSRSNGALPDAPFVLRIGGDCRAGWMLPAAGATDAVRISTGAPIPAGFDTVLARELAERDGDTLRLTSLQIIGVLGCYGIDRVVIARWPARLSTSTASQCGRENQCCAQCSPVARSISGFPAIRSPRRWVSACWSRPRYGKYSVWG